MSYREILRRPLAMLGLIAAALFLLMPLQSAFAQTVTPAASDAGPVLAPIPDATPRSGKPIKVVTSTPLLSDIARQVGGARVEVSSILPANADPHDYEPAPDDLVKVDDADLIIEHGLNLDAWASELIKDSGANAPVVIATTGVPTLKSNEDGFKDGDPHVWFDPTNVKIMAANIAAGLAQVDPDGSADYAARSTAYQAQLDSLDTWIKSQIATIPPDRRKLVTNHDAFGYFVNRYGLTFVGSVIPSLDSRAEPSAAETADLIDKIKAENVPAIFTESSINPSLEEELGKEAGVKVVPNLYGDNLGSPGSGADTYIGMMVTDTRLIVDALR